MTLHYVVIDNYDGEAHPTHAGPDEAAGRRAYDRAYPGTRWESSVSLWSVDASGSYRCLASKSGKDDRDED